MAGAALLTPCDRDGLGADLPAFDVSSLTDRQVEVLCMRLRSGLSFREIGRLLGIGDKTVREHYWSALEKLSPSLQPKS